MSPSNSGWKFSSYRIIDSSLFPNILHLPFNCTVLVPDMFLVSIGFILFYFFGLLSIPGRMICLLAPESIIILSFCCVFSLVILRNGKNCVI